MPASEKNADLYWICLLEYLLLLKLMAWIPTILTPQT